MSAPQIPLTGSIGIPGSASLTGYQAIVIADANHTLTADEWAHGFLDVSSSVSLTAIRNIVSPLNQGQQFVVSNKTTGGFAIQVIGSTGTGASIPNGSTILVYTDGVNYSSSGNLSGVVPISDGGTGATTAPAALVNLGAAASGANDDISSTGALATINIPTGAILNIVPTSGDPIPARVTVGASGSAQTQIDALGPSGTNSGGTATWSFTNSTGALSAKSIALNGSQVLTGVQGTSGTLITSFSTTTGPTTNGTVVALDSNGNLFATSSLVGNIGFRNTSGSWTGNQTFATLGSTGLATFNSLVVGSGTAFTGRGGTSNTIASKNNSVVPTSGNLASWDSGQNLTDSGVPVLNLALLNGGSAFTVTQTMPTIILSAVPSATSATSGSASILPTLPLGYLTLTVNGSSVKIPYYAV